VRVRASEALIVEVFLALLVNAAQAIEPGAPEENRVQVSLRATEHHALVVIADTGAGIPEELHDRVFEPFFTTRPGHGTGLGLSVCHGIVTALGGALELRSEPGSGTTALVRIPLDGS
jgi:signal transduction histidine kinase